MVHVFITLYILSPYISKLVTACSDNELLVYILICIVLNQTAKSYEIFMGQSTLLNTLYKDMTGACLSFFVFGFWYCRKYNNGERNIKNMLIGAIVFVATVFVKLYVETDLNRIVWNYNWYNTSITIALSSFGAFVFLYELTKKLNAPSWIIFISKLSFGVYLIHYGILLAFAYYFKDVISTLDPTVRVITLLIASLTAYPLCFILSKNKFTNWLIGN